MARRAYLVFEIEITDREGYEEYRDLSRGVPAKYGGVLLAGSIFPGELRLETLEGEWRPPSLIIVEFPSYDKAREFYFSAEYQRALAVRLRTSKSRAILVEARE